MATDEEVELAEKLRDITDDIRNGRKEEKDLAEEVKKLTEKQIDDLLKIADLNEKIRAALQQQKANEQASWEKLRDRVDEMGKYNDKLKEEIGLTNQKYTKAVLTDELQRSTIERRRTEIKLLKQKLREQKHLSDEDAKKLDDLEKLEKKLSTFGNKASDIAKGIFSGDAAGITGALKNIGGSMKTELTDNIQKAFHGAENLADGFKAAKGALGKLLLVEYVTAIAKLAVDLGNAENAFMKATGASEDFARSISDTYEEGRKFTATAEDMSKSATSLFNNFTDFTYQDKQTRDGLIETGAVLEKLGISNETFAKSVQLSTKALGMSAEDAGQAMLDLEKYAEELGVSPDRLSGQFLEAGDAMAKLGETGDEAFRDLAAASKVTGLEVSKLLNIVNQFDTFEGAARQAGKLNAALGGNFVNAMDLMMETDPTARFEMIRDSILDTGLSFDSMSYYQKNFYKDALGLSDVGELALVLSGNMDSVGEATKKTSQEYEDAAERAKTVASFQEQLNAAFAQLIPILTPLIDAFRGLVTFVSENIGLFKVLGGVLLATFGGIPGIVIAVMGLLDAIKMGSDKVSVLSALMKGMAVPFKFVSDGFKELKETIVNALGGTDEFSKKMEGLIPIVEGLGTLIGIVLIFPLMKAALVFGKVAAAVVWLTTGISTLMAAFAEKNSPSFFDMFTGGLLVNSLEAVTKVFSKVKSGFEVIGEAVKSVTIKIKNMIETIGSMKDAVMNSWLAQTAIKGYNMAFGDDDDEVGNVQGPAQMTAKAATTAAMSNLKEDMIAAQAAQAGRTAAPTAANTNISQTSSKTTYVNSGPETAVFDVRIGDEKLGRVVQKISEKNIRNGITGRG